MAKAVVVRATGILCLVGAAFLLQELLRHVVAVAPQSVTHGGWLDLSGAALPASWLYFAAHIWAVLFLLRWRKVPGVGRPDWAVFGLLATALVGVHVLVHGPLDQWTIRPFVY